MIYDKKMGDYVCVQYIEDGRDMFSQGTLTRNYFDEYFIEISNLKTDWCIRINKNVILKIE